MSAVTIPFIGNMKYADIKKYLPDSCSIVRDSIQYRGQNIKLIVNHGNIKPNKFQDAFTFKIKNTSNQSIIPEGDIVIDFSRLDRLIDFIDSHSKKAENEKRAATFKLQLFEPYLTDALIAALPEDVRSGALIKRVDDGVHVTYEFVTSIMKVNFTLKEKNTDVIEKEMDDYTLILNLAFKGDQMPQKTYTLKEWKLLIPNLFKEFVHCVADLRLKNKIREDLNAAMANDVNRLKKICDNEIENVKRTTMFEINRQCTTRYDGNWMMTLLNNLTV